jgi:hypothetical protein
MTKYHARQALQAPAVLISRNSEVTEETNGPLVEVCSEQHEIEGAEVIMTESRDKKPENSMSTELLREIYKRFPPLLNQRQYCELTGKRDSTAEQDRLYGRGAPFVRMGRSIRYRLDDVVAWLERLPRFSSTTEADGGNLTGKS